MFGQARPLPGQLWCSAEAAALPLRCANLPECCLPQGNITLAEVSTTMPYGNWVVVKKLTGDEVMQALENAVANVAKPAGQFAQVGRVAQWVV